MTLRSLFASAALLLAAAAPARAEGWELGVGVQGGWATLEEAGSGGFAVDEQPGYGLALGVSRRLSAATSVELEVLAGRHGTTLPDINAAWSSGALGLRYGFAGAGGLRPYLRGGVGGVNVRIAPEGGGERLDLKGLCGVMGAGLRLAVTERLQFDLELAHRVVNYDDDSVVIESVYTGTRIDKAGSFTTLAFVARLGL
ncbi:MAG: outer membrane beta-barrel protein [Candidatus Krumholzibacteriia bacterium]|nr:outer membrane beta-barrel protein [bacterium]